MWQALGFLLLAILGSVAAQDACGYDTCAAVDPTRLNVHIVPHSLVNLNGRETLDQYYYGTENNGFQDTLNAILDALDENTDRKIIHPETAFFWRWWSEQNETRELQIQRLVNGRQLEFIGGGWSMNDEATTHYYSIIDQLTWGLKRLDEVFGTCGHPHVAWQTNTFGHSKEMASLIAQLGYDGLFLRRLDYRDIDNRRTTQTAELVWEGNPNLGTNADIFTSVLPNPYCSDPTTCVLNIVDDPDSADYNVDAQVTQFTDFVNAEAAYYSTNNVLITIGGDFVNGDAATFFQNVDRLIQYVNAANNDTVNVLYSSPSCYVKAVNDVGQTYTTKQDDFFPYAVDEHSYWTGFYTSRPSNKYFERLANNYLQVTKQLAALTRTTIQIERMDNLRDALGSMQNHQAITGTDQQHVSDDYVKILRNAIEDTRWATMPSINEVITLYDYNGIQVQDCLLLNVSYCEVSERDQFIVTVYNPLSYTTDHVVRFPIVEGTYLIQDINGNGVPHQFLPIPQSVLVLPEREGSAALFDMVFRATDLPPLGLRSYYIRRISSDFVPVLPRTATSISNENLQVNVDPVTGFVASIVSNGVTFPLDQRFHYYESFTGDNVDNRSSGAYVFRPSNQDPTPVSNTAFVQVYQGDIVSEIHQIFNNWVTQIVRVYSGDNHVEFEWLVGPIPVDDGIGKEVISSFTTDFDTGGVFYTDANGRQILERRRNFRPTWELDVTEPISENYYPVTSTILIRDSNNTREFSVLTDRAQGGSSINDGQVELMVHRRLLNDDGFGLEEPLDELEFDIGLVVRGKHYVIIGNTGGTSPTIAAQRKSLATRKVLTPWPFFTPSSVDFISWTNTHTMVFVGMNQDLPSNVAIQTLEILGDNTLLLRLEHIMEPGDDDVLSQPVTVNFQNIFTTLNVNSYQETTLGGNQLIGDVNRLAWNYISTSQQTLNDTTLAPSQIRTYILTITRL